MSRSSFKDLLLVRYELAYEHKESLTITVHTDISFDANKLLHQNVVRRLLVRRFRLTGSLM